MNNGVSFTLTYRSGYLSPGSRPRWNIIGCWLWSVWLWVVTPSTFSPGQKLIPCNRPSLFWLPKRRFRLVFDRNVAARGLLKGLPPLGHTPTTLILQFRVFTRRAAFLRHQHFGRISQGDSVFKYNIPEDSNQSKSSQAPNYINHVIINYFAYQNSLFCSHSTQQF